MQNIKFNFIKDLLEGGSKCYLTTICLFQEWGLMSSESLIIQLGSNVKGSKPIKRVVYRIIYIRPINW